MLHWNILFILAMVTITLQVSGLPESSDHGRRFRRADAGDDESSSAGAQGDEPHDKTESEKTAAENQTSDGHPEPSDDHPVSPDENTETSNHHRQSSDDPAEPSESHSEPSSDEPQPVAGHHDEHSQPSDEHPKDDHPASSDDHPAPLNGDEEQAGDHISNGHPAPADSDEEKSDDPPASSDGDADQPDQPAPSDNHPAPSDSDADQPDQQAPSEEHSAPSDSDTDQPDQQAPSDEHPAPSDDHPAPSDGDEEKSDDHPAPADSDADQPDQPSPSESDQEKSNDPPASSDGDSDQPDQPAPSDDHPAPSDDSEPEQSENPPAPKSEHLEPENHQTEPADDNPVPSGDGSKPPSDHLEASENHSESSDTGSSDKDLKSSDKHPEPLKNSQEHSEENPDSAESSGEVAAENDKHPDELLTVIEDALKTAHPDTPKEEAVDQGSPPATAAPHSKSSEDDAADEDKEEASENDVDHLLTEDKKEKDKTLELPREEEKPAEESTETSDDADDASQDEDADDESPASSPASTPPPSSSDGEAESEAGEGEKEESEVVLLPSHVEDDAEDKEEHLTPLPEASSEPRSEEDGEKSVLIPEGEAGEESNEDAGVEPVTEQIVESEKEKETSTASSEGPEDEAAKEEVIDPDVADMLNAGSSKASNDSDTEDMPIGSEGLVLGSVIEDTDDGVVTSPAPTSGEAGSVADADDDKGENGKPKSEEEDDGDVVTEPLTPSADDDNKGDLLVLSEDKSEEESEEEKPTADGEITTETPQDGNLTPGEESDGSHILPVVTGSGDAEPGDEIAEKNTSTAQSSTLAPEGEDLVAEGEGHDASQDATETAPPPEGNNDTETGVLAPVLPEPGVDELGEEKNTTDDSVKTSSEDEASSLDGSGDEESSVPPAVKETDDVGNNTHAGADTENVDVDVEHLPGDRTSTAATSADTTLAILSGEERKNETESGPVIDVGPSVDDASGTELSPPESTPALSDDEGKNETAVSEGGTSTGLEDDDGSGDVTDDKVDGVAIVDTTTIVADVEKNETVEAGVVVGVEDVLGEESTPAAASSSTTPPETTSMAEAEEPGVVDVAIPHDGNEEEAGETMETTTTQRIPPLEELESSTPSASDVIDLEPANTSGIVVDDGKEDGDNGETDVDKTEDIDVSVDEEAENTTRSRHGLRRGPGVSITMEESEDNQSGTKVQSAQQKESEDDAADKQRTAIIVGVTIGGIGLFAIGFLASRYCKKRGGFKIMKKVPQDVGNGNSEAIEFRPVQTGAGIYDEVDEVRRASNKPIYRRPPPKATYTPLTTSYTPLTTSAAPNNDVYAVPDKKKPVQREEPQDSYINGIDKIRFMDETTDDEADATPKDRLLQPRPREEDVQEEEEEFFSTPEAEEDVKQSPESTVSGDSPTSFTTAVMMNLDKRGISEDGAEAEGPGPSQS